jgi:hypothetical protein
VYLNREQNELSASLTINRQVNNSKMARSNLFSHHHTTNFSAASGFEALRSLPLTFSAISTCIIFSGEQVG